MITHFIILSNIDSFVWKKGDFRDFSNDDVYVCCQRDVTRGRRPKCKKEKIIFPRASAKSRVPTGGSRGFGRPCGHSV